MNCEDKAVVVRSLPKGLWNRLSWIERLNQFSESQLASIASGWLAEEAKVPDELLPEFSGTSRDTPYDFTWNIKVQPADPFAEGHRTTPVTGAQILERVNGEPLNELKDQCRESHLVKFEQF